MTEEIDKDVHIVEAAARRGLGARPAWQRAAAVLWSSFLGATCSLLTLLLTPEEWMTPPYSEARLAAIFATAWLLAMIPAIAASYLATPSRDRDAR